MGDKPNDPFNRNGKPNFRDKDNASPRPTPPSQARFPAPNIAPPGASGIHLSRYDDPQPQTKEQDRGSQVVSIVKTHPNPNLLTGGRFLDHPGTGFAVEISPYRSFAGIEAGRIDALEIQEEGKIVAQYQKMQWTVKPDRQDHVDLVQRLQDQFGEPNRDRDFVPIVPVPDKDHGHER